MRLYFLSILIFTFTIQSFASLIEVSGIVSGIWNTDTVLVVGNITVPNTSTLNIEPGVLVLFDGHYIIKVEGNVMANGLDNDSISFKVADTSGFSNLQSNEGAWNGLWFEHLSPVNDSSLFEYCKFEYGKAIGTDSTYWYGGVFCIRQYDKIRISNCKFLNNTAYKNGGAIYALTSNFKIEHCEFKNNNCGLEQLYGYGGGVCLEYSEATIYRNHFIQNRSTGVGGGLSFEYSNPRIESNSFLDNYSAIGGGLVCLRSDGDQPIVNNLFVGNNAFYFGGGLATLETSMLFTNNTIADNTSGAGGGLYVNANSFSIFKNCILWGNSCPGNNGLQVYIWDTYSAPEFYYCDIEGGVEAFSGTGGIGSGFIGVYENCLEEDPQFNLSGSFLYGVSDGSPCINSGTPDTTGLLLPETDLSGQNRFRGSQLDMGAYESQIATSDNAFLRIEDRIKIFPNPITDKAIISVELESNAAISISLFDLYGKMVWQKPTGYIPKRNHEIILKDNNFKSGYYVLSIKITGNPTKTIRKKVLFL
jgi:predicted outer membrane repeat protein